MKIIFKFKKTKVMMSYY